MCPSSWKNRTLSHFSKPNFDMPWPKCWKSYKVNGDPPFCLTFLVKKNICRHLLFCTIALAFIIRELCFTKVWTMGVELKYRCRTLDVWRTFQYVKSRLVPFYKETKSLYNKSKTVRGYWSLLKELRKRRHIPLPPQSTVLNGTI